jgi:hypothetical protein
MLGRARGTCHQARRYPRTSTARTTTYPTANQVPAAPPTSSADAAIATTPPMPVSVRTRKTVSSVSKRLA